MSKIETTTLNDWILDLENTQINLEWLIKRIEDPFPNQLLRALLRNIKNLEEQMREVQK